MFLIISTLGEYRSSSLDPWGQVKTPRFETLNIKIGYTRRCIVIDELARQLLRNDRGCFRKRIPILICPLKTTVRRSIQLGLCHR